MSFSQPTPPPAAISPQPKLRTADMPIGSHLRAIF
jgi:hypothetical protein